jgi:hypothetical protein
MSDKKNIILGDMLTKDFSFRVPDRKTQRKPKSNKEIKIKGPKEKVKSLRKKNFLSRFRDLQEKNYKELLDSSAPSLSSTSSKSSKNEMELASDFNNSFDESVKYMQALSEKIETPPKNNTLKSYSSSAPTESWVYTTPMESLSQLDTHSIHPANSPPIHLAEPKWGCMKNGKLPTYRNWKNTTQKAPSGVSSIAIHRPSSS